VGLSPELLRSVVVTPTCGLAGRDPAGARETLVRCVEAAKALTEASAD
jgi:methionine synthase II (cobalamin-independent)